MLTGEMRLLGQKQRTLLLIAKTVARVSFVCVNFPCSQNPTAVAQRAHYGWLNTQLVILYKGNIELGESTIFIVSGNKPALFLGGGVSSSLCKNTAPKHGLDKDWSGPSAFLAYVTKMCRDVQSPWQIVSPNVYLLLECTNVIWDSQ